VQLTFYRIDALSVLNCLDQAVTNLRALHAIPFAAGNVLEFAQGMIDQVNQFARVTLNIIENPLRGQYLINFNYFYNRIVTLDRTSFTRPMLTVDLQFLAAFRKIGVAKQVDRWFFKKRGLERWRE